MIKPQILKGTRDFGQEDMSKRNYVKDTIRGVFELFGYDPIETPVIEYAETILGKYGDEGDKLTYNFKDQGDRHVALRYDQTVPFARYFAANHGELPVPFKRYEINRVWRADKPQKGRYREFYQCDVDIIGTDSILAELELIQIIHLSLNKLGLKKFVIKINDRALMDSLMEKAKIEETARLSVIRIIDKLDKIGKSAVIEEFKKIELTAAQIKELEPILDCVGSNKEKLEKFKGLRTERVEKLLNLIEGTELEEFVSFDVSLARGLDYYTGIIFETIIPDTGLGSVVGGGRYANLCGSFSKQEFSGVGIALGFDRIVDALEILGLFKNITINVEVLVTQFDDALENETLKIAEVLRKAGINTEMYFEPVKLEKQLKYADKKGIPNVLIFGPEEKAKNICQVKNMETGVKTELKIEASEFKKYFRK